jgi:hypothetical protein
MASKADSSKSESKHIGLLREMQVGFDEELKDLSRKVDALAELVIDILHGLPLAPEQKDKVRGAL